MMLSSTMMNLVKSEQVAARQCQTTKRVKHVVLWALVVNPAGGDWVGDLASRVGWSDAPLI